MYLGAKLKNKLNNFKFEIFYFVPYDKLKKKYIIQRQIRET